MTMDAGALLFRRYAILGQWMPRKMLGNVVQ